MKRGWYMAKDDRFIALDSVRSFTPDGYMNVAKANISKANICEYFGYEIPDYEELGLEKNRKYRLLRHPDELKKAAATFNNLPILDEHIPVTSEEFPEDSVIGSTGTDAQFEEPYLTNSLVFWKRPAIEDIEAADDGQGGSKELSCAYRYRADMTPGTYKGEHYDGIMCDLVGNHVAKVKQGRAGSDVLVGDEKPKGVTMAKRTPLTRKGAMLHGALIAVIAPKLATDAKPLNIAPLLVGITDRNYAKRKKALVAGLTRLIKPHLAADASAEGLAELIDALEKVPQMEGKDAPAAGTEPNSGLPLHAGENDEPEDGEDEEQPDPDHMANYGKVRDMLKKAGVDEETMAGCDAEMGYTDEPDGEDEGISAKANAEGEEEPEENPAKGKKAPPGLDKKGGKMAGDKAVTKQAMDKALADQRVKLAQDAKNLREAERFVRPWLGNVELACDSAGEVYKLALETLRPDLDLSTIHPSAFRSMIELIPQPSHSMASDEGMAEDGDDSNESALYKFFPEAKRAARA